MVVEEKQIPYCETDRFCLHEGDCRSVLPIFSDCYFDSIVTDPPYFLTNENGNGFMGKAWDSLSLSNAIVDALFRSARLDLNTDAESIAPPDVNTPQTEDAINQTASAPFAERVSIVANRKSNQTTNFVQGLVITKQEALALCGVLLPDHTAYLQSLPTSAVLVVSDLSTALSGKSIARKLAAILLDEPAWLEQITTFTSTGKIERSVIEASNGNSFVSKPTSATDIAASDAESIAEEKKFNVTTLFLTTFQEITAKIISSPFATRAIRLCTSDPSLIPVLSEVFHRRWSREAFRVLKPGAHLLAFAGTRTYHRLVSALEDEGFEIRDQLQWIHGQGFPKSLDISKQLDAMAGVEREIVGFKVEPDGRCMALESELPRICNPSDKEDRKFGSDNRTLIERKVVTAPTTDAAKKWQGFGTALKPAHEPIVLARKPLIGTVAQNILEHGTGGLNIDGCRIETSDSIAPFGSPRKSVGGLLNTTEEARETYEPHSLGRWPANVIHDGSEEVLAGFPETESGEIRAGQSQGTNFRQSHTRTAQYDVAASSGSASRFFYCAKATQEDRNEGLEDLPHRVADDVHKRPRTELDDPRRHGVTPRQNYHPTVKPTELMRYLCRLITPSSGLVLDPFCGSGSTGKAAMLEGLRFVGIELNADYCELAQRRIEAATKQGLLFA